MTDSREERKWTLCGPKQLEGWTWQLARVLGPALDKDEEIIVVPSSALTQARERIKELEQRDGKEHLLSLLSTPEAEDG